MPEEKEAPRGVERATLKQPTIDTVLAWPAPGQSVAFRPSHRGKYPQVTSRVHDEFHLHISGFHVRDKNNKEERKRMKMPQEGCSTQLLWTDGRVVPERVVDAFHKLDDEFIANALDTENVGAMFEHHDDWSSNEKCPKGDCLFTILHVIIPKRMLWPPQLMSPSDVKQASSS